MTTAGTLDGRPVEGAHPALLALVEVDAAVTAFAAVAGDGLWSVPEAQLLALRRAMEATAARLAAVTLTVTREVDERGAAVSVGAPCTAAWLMSSLRLHPGAARREVALAHSLTHSLTSAPPDVTGGSAGALLRGGDGAAVALPVTGAALAAGEVSLASAAEIDKAIRALPATVEAETRDAGETFLLAQARHLRPDQITRLGAHLHQVLDPDAAARAELDEAERVARRELYVSRGSGLVNGRLDTEAAEALLTALSPLAAPLPGPDGSTDPRSPARRRADALVELVAIALGSGDLPVEGGDLPQVLLTVPLATLHQDDPGAAPSVPPRAGEWPDGTPVPAEAARRLTCDADLTAAILGSVGQILGMGRTTRAIPRRLRRALHARDRGCAFPGCDRPAGWCHAHHIQHWAHGGPTELDNLVLLCAHHHRVVHHHGWTVHIDPPGLPAFTPPRWVDPDQIPITRPWRTAIDHLPLRT